MNAHIRRALGPHSPTLDSLPPWARTLVYLWDRSGLPLAILLTALAIGWIAYRIRKRVRP